MQRMLRGGHAATQSTLWIRSDVIIFGWRARDGLAFPKCGFGAEPAYSNGPFGGLEFVLLEVRAALCPKCVPMYRCLVLSQWHHAFHGDVYCFIVFAPCSTMIFMLKSS